MRAPTAAAMTNDRPDHPNEAIPDASVQSSPARFGYFVLQAAVPLENAARAVRVVLEDLASGEKHSFTSSRALASFLDEWAGVPSEKKESRV